MEKNFEVAKEKADKMIEAWQDDLRKQEGWNKWVFGFRGESKKLDQGRDLLAK